VPGPDVVEALEEGLRAGVDPRRRARTGESVHNGESVRNDETADSDD
jgi:hypothetical protein